MAINFPSSPANNQVFYPTNGPIFIFKTGKGWTRNSGTANRFNKVVNPTFQISQQNGTTGGSTTGYYPADQWIFQFSGTYSNTLSSKSAATTPNGSPYVINFNADNGP